MKLFYYQKQTKYDNDATPPVLEPEEQKPELQGYQVFGKNIQMPQQQTKYE